MLQRFIEECLRLRIVYFKFIYFTGTLIISDSMRWINSFFKRYFMIVQYLSGRQSQGLVRGHQVKLFVNIIGLLRNHAKNKSHSFIG